MADGGSKPPQPMSPEQPKAALPSTPHPTGMLRDGVEVADGGMMPPQPSLG